MSIGLQCPTCGRRYRVTDDREGTSISCHCGRPIRVEGVRYDDKLCAICGIDVSSLTRTRDPNGNYYCQPCWDAAVHAKQKLLVRQRDPDMAWITRQLSTLRLWHVMQPLMILAALGLLGLSWKYPWVGEIMGATLAILGGGMLIICTVWLYGIPFRDGPSVGFACMLSRVRRRNWAIKNPEFNLRRPAVLIISGIWMLALSAAFFAVWATALARLAK